MRSVCVGVGSRAGLQDPGYVLAKKLARRDEQPASDSGESGRPAGVANRGQPQAAQARLTAQRPLAPDDPVVTESGNRQPLRAPPADARGSDRSERPHRAQRIGAEVARSAHHPTGMTAARAEADSVRVQGDPLRPARDRRLQSRVACDCGSGNRERDCGKTAQDKEDLPAD